MSVSATTPSIPCTIYRSRIKDGMYLYLADGTAYDALPESIRQGMGRDPEVAMRLTLTAERKLARVDIANVLQALQTQGFFLQLPPRPEYLAHWDNDKLGLKAESQT